MQAFTDFIMTVELPAQSVPERRRLAACAIPAVRGDLSLAVGDPRRGEGLFTTNCSFCHQLPEGTSNQLIATNQRPQDFKVPHLRNAYQKIDFDALRSFDPALVDGPAARRRGFFMLNDGVMDLTTLVWAMLPGGGADGDDVTAFVLAFPSESFPCVGRQLSVSAPVPAGDVATLIEEARRGHCDLVAKGVSGGKPAGWVYDASVAGFVPDSARAPVVTASALSDALALGELVTFMAVPPGNGVRLGIDRDRDGCLDGTSSASAATRRTPACESPTRTTTAFRTPPICVKAGCRRMRRRPIRTRMGCRTNASVAT